LHASFGVLLDNLARSKCLKFLSYKHMRLSLIQPNDFDLDSCRFDLKLCSEWRVLCGTFLNFIGWLPTYMRPSL